MKLKTAKPWMIGALAGVLVAVAYGALVAYPMERQALELRHQIARHGSAAERAERIDRAQAETSRLEVERSVMQETAAVGATAGAPLATGTLCRSLALEAISRIGERQGVTLISTGAVGERDAMTAPEAFRLAGWQSPSLWRVDARGSYASMTAFLDDVANGDVAAIPVSLDLRADSEATEWRLWRILFWM